MDKALPHRVMSIMPGILTAITKPERTVQTDKVSPKHCSLCDVARSQLRTKAVLADVPASDKTERTAKPDKSTIALVNIIANKHGQAQTPDIGEAR